MEHQDGSQIWQLAALLATGGRIRAPIIRRPAYLSPEGRVCSLELCIEQDRVQRHLAVPDTPAVRMLLDGYELQLIDL